MPPYLLPYLCLHVGLTRIALKHQMVLYSQNHKFVSFIKIDQKDQQIFVQSLLQTIELFTVKS